MPSSMAVARAVPRLSRGISPEPYHAAYAPFKPSDTEQRLPPLYYRGCWHRVSRDFLWCLCQHDRVLTYAHSKHLTAVYNPKTFIPHAASLRQTCVHCGRFSTAASRRSLGSVSVPVWAVSLSARLPVDALVSHYLTNKLIGRGPLHERKPEGHHLPTRSCLLAGPSGITGSFPPLFRSRGQVVHALLTLAPLY